MARLCILSHGIITGCRFPSSCWSSLPRHASWNAIVKRGPDKFLGTVLVTGSAALLSAAALPLLPFPAAHSWPWLAASVLLQVTYYGLVARCYQQVDMSLAYPLMRGCAPILVALAGTLLGETLPAAAWLGWCW